MNLSKRRGQIWVETVIYTLIGLAIIGIVLSVAQPKINAKKDEVVIDQSIEALGNIDDKISSVVGSSPGNTRIIDLVVGKGEVVIDMDNEAIIWKLDSRVKYSQENIEIELGKIKVKTVQDGGEWDVTLRLDYNYDLQFEGQNSGTKPFFKAATPYKLTVENDGLNPNDGKIIIMFRE